MHDATICQGDALGKGDTPTATPTQKYFQPVIGADPLSDRAFIEPELDTSAMVLSHACNLYSEYCTNDKCLFLNCPPGACKKALILGYCPHQNRYDLGHATNPSLTPCDRKFHVVLSIGGQNNARTWHKLTKPGTPLPSSQLTSEEADAKAKVLFDTKKQTEAGVARIRVGKYAVDVSIEAALEVKDEHTRDLGNGVIVSAREKSKETSGTILRRHDGMALIAEGRAATQSAQQKRRRALGEH